MAKKTRSMRRAENTREMAAPQVPNSAPGATAVAAPRIAPPKVPPPTGVGAPAPARTARTTRATESTPRLTSEETSREMGFVRIDLRRIAILATTIFVILIALAFIVPRFLG